LQAALPRVSGSTSLTVDTAEAAAAAAAPTWLEVCDVISLRHPVLS